MEDWWVSKEEGIEGIYMMIPLEVKKDYSLRLMSLYMWNFTLEMAKEEFWKHTVRGKCIHG